MEDNNINPNPEVYDHHNIHLIKYQNKERIHKDVV
jgi:hypothetical protein